MRKFIVEEVLDIPKDINVYVEKDKIVFKKGNNTIEIKKEWPTIIVEKKENKLIFRIYFATRRDIRVFYTLVGKSKNAIEGLSKGFVYRLRAVYTHFPFKISVKGNKFVVENFLGEKAPRVLEIPQDVKVKVEGNDIIVEGYNIERAGNVAGLLEQLTKIREKDLRKFQDGIYIIEKP